MKVNLLNGLTFFINHRQKHYLELDINHQKQLNRDHLTVLKSLVKTGGTGNVMEILGYAPDRFEEGFALANEMQNLDFVKLLYSNFNKNLVVVELTLVGQFKAESNG